MRHEMNSVWYGSFDTCHNDLQSFKGLTHPSDQDPSWVGSLQPKIEKTRLISIESQPKKIVVVVVIGVGLVVVHVVAVVIPVVDTRNIPNKVWLKPGY